MAIDGAEGRALGDSGGGEPRLVGGGRAGESAGAADCEHDPVPLGIGLALADRHPQPLGQQITLNKLPW